MPRFLLHAFLAPLIVLSLGLLGCASANKPESSAVVVGGGGQLLFRPNAVNSPEALQKPYVILISIDGYRHDYNKIFSPPNLNALAAQGVAAESLRPVYPSKTFPNHYSIITGLRADRHGIVSNEFYDPARDTQYSLPDRKAVEDGSWYLGDPIWNTAGRQGMISASFFWVGSEANISGGHPNYFYRYNGEVDYSARVDQVLAWLKVPPERRPHFLTLYFEAVDSAAHEFGVNSQQTKDAVMKVDQAIGRLRDGVAASQLPVNIVVVSDHGMHDVDPKKVITLDATPEAARLLAKFRAVGRGPQMLMYLNKGESDAVIAETQKALSKVARGYRVHRRSEMTKFSFSATPRVGDLIVEPDAPYTVGMRAALPHGKGANHGWDPMRFKTMHGIFFAQGPAFKEKARLATFDNVDVYPLLLRVLGLKQEFPIDGKFDNVRAALK